MKKSLMLIGLVLALGFSFLAGRYFHEIKMPTVHETDRDLQRILVSLKEGTNQETFTQLEELTFQLIRQVYFLQKRFGGRDYSFEGAQKIFFELLITESSNYLTNTCPAQLYGRLQIGEGLVTSSKSASSYNLYVATLGFILMRVEMVNSAVYKEFMEKKKKEFYFPDLVKSLAEYRQKGLRTPPRSVLSADSH